MSVQAVYDALIAAPAVTALVGSRISPLERKEYDYPAIVLTSSSTPANVLKGAGNIDSHSVTITYWDVTYVGVHQLADAGRAAVEAAGLVLDSEEDEFAALASLAGLASVTQIVSFWA